MQTEGGAQAGGIEPTVKRALCRRRIIGGANRQHIGRPGLERLPARLRPLQHMTGKAVPARFASSYQMVKPGEPA